MSDHPAEETVKSRRGFGSRSACKKSNSSCKDRSFTEKHLLGQATKKDLPAKSTTMCWAEEMISSSSPVKPRRTFRSSSKKINTLSKDGSFKKKEATSMVDLPRDLAEEVFSRLPVTSLRGARFTCKKWNTLTKAESFFKKHIGEQASTVVVVIEFRVYLMALNLQVDPSITCQGKLTSLDNSDRVDISLVYHCDGLLLCIAKDFASFVVWNPYTSQTLWLEPRSPHPRLDWYSYAIGYAAENSSKSSCRRSYKILRFIDRLRNDFVEHEIYDLSSNSWRVLDVTPDWHIESYARGVSLKGITYWFARERYPAKPAVGEPYEVADFLICFNFTTERFGPRLGLPFHTGFECTATLSSVREEQLAVLFQIDNSLYMEIWVTTKIEPEEVSWNKLFLAVNMEPFLDFQFGMSQGSFFIDEEKRVVVVFDKDTGMRFTRNIAYVIGEGGYFRQVDLGESIEYHRPFGCSYVPSLAQIKQ